MRLLGITLVLAGLSPVLIVGYLMLKAFISHTSVDAIGIHRAMILAFDAIPVFALGVIFLIVGVVPGQPGTPGRQALRRIEQLRAFGGLMGIGAKHPAAAAAVPNGCAE